VLDKAVERALALLSPVDSEYAGVWCLLLQALAEKQQLEEEEGADPQAVDRRFQRAVGLCRADRWGHGFVCRTQLFGVRDEGRRTVKTRAPDRAQSFAARGRGRSILGGGVVSWIDVDQCLRGYWLLGPQGARVRDVPRLGAADSWQRGGGSGLRAGHGPGQPRTGGATPAGPGGCQRAGPGRRGGGEIKRPSALPCWRCLSDIWATDYDWEEDRGPAASTCG
jgi:hypothetical protein